MRPYPNLRSLNYTPRGSHATVHVSDATHALTTRAHRRNAPPHREPPVAVAAQLLGVRRRRDRQLHHWQLHHTGADGDEREVVQVQRQQQRLRAGTAGG